MNAASTGWALRRDTLAAAGLDGALPARLDRVLGAATRPPVTGGRALVAGAAAVVARAGVVAYEAGHGAAQTHDGPERLDRPRPVRPDTRFDVASVTKLVATSAAALALVDRGQLHLDDDLGTLLPAVAAGARDPGFPGLTVEQLLTHRAGLAAWEPTYLHADRPAGALARVAALPLVSAPGAERRYSDLSMMLLGGVVTEVTGRPLDVAVDGLVCAPLGLTATGYGPVAPTAAATSRGNPFERRMIATGTPHAVDGDPDDFPAWRRHTLVGEVNDGNAHHAFGGVAGHAGLFATAGDLARFAGALLAGIAGRDTPLAGTGTVRRFLDPPSAPVLGAFEGRLEPVLGSGAGGLGHAGFTGCELLLDPARDLVVVLLTNRQHPDEPYPAIGVLWQQVLRTVLDAVV